jgi:hypothetical protein
VRHDVTRDDLHHRRRRGSAVRSVSANDRDEKLVLTAGAGALLLILLALLLIGP